MNPPSNSLWRGRAVIIVVALISIIPFGLAWHYARHPELIGATSNYGTLILPPRRIDYGRLLAPSGELSDLEGRWVLLHVASGPCREACAESLHKTRQVRLMLNKEVSRVRRLLLRTAEAPAADLKDLIGSDAALLTAGVSESLLRDFAEAMGKPPGEGRVLLLDPRAHLILWYETDFDPYKMLKDLKHLLRASRIG